MSGRKKQTTRAGRYGQKFISRYFLVELRYTVYISVFSFLYFKKSVFNIYLFHILPNINETIHIKGYENKVNVTILCAKKG